MRPSSSVRAFVVSRRVAYILAAVLVGGGPGTDWRLAAADQPNQSRDAAQSDRPAPPPPGTQPTGEQHRNPGIDTGTDPRGNDRELTTERGDRSGSSEPRSAAEAGISPIAMAIAAVAILAVAAVLMAVRRRKSSPSTGG